jgi:hypothetical protein
MKMKGLVITDHARQRFLERLHWTTQRGVEKPDALLWKLLQKATSEKRYSLGHHLYRRKKYTDTTEFYTTECGWRFVVDHANENRPILETVERINKAQNKPYRRNHHE